MEAKYHDKEEGKKRAALQGEGSWMLPSVEDQLRSRMVYFLEISLMHELDLNHFLKFYYIIAL